MSMSATSSAPKLLAKAIWEPNVSAAQRTISSADLPVICSFSSLTFSGLSAVAVTSLVTWWYLLGISLALSCAPAGLQRALSLAADDLEELFLAPVEVGVDLLAYGAHFLELVEDGVEVLGADAVDVVQETLTIMPFSLVRPDDLGDGPGHALHGDAGDAGAELAAADVVAAAQEDVVAGDVRLTRLERRALQTDGAQVVLAAAVGAAAHLDRDLLHQRVIDAHLQHGVAESVSRALGGRDPHLAAVGARAGDDIGDESGLGRAQPDGGELGVDGGQGVLTHPAQDQVLVLLRAGGTAAEPPHRLREGTELLRRQVAHGDGDRDGDVALLALAADVRLQPALQLRRRLVAVRGRLARRRPLGGELGERLHLQRLHCPRLRQLLLHLAPELVDADLFDKELHAGLGHVLAQEVRQPALAVEHLDHRLRGADVLAVLHRDEVEDRVGLAGHGGETAADADLETAHLAAVLIPPDPGDEAEVMEGGAGAVAGAAGEGGLPLTREALADGVPEHVSGVGHEVGRGVKHLVGAGAGVGVAGVLLGKDGAGFHLVGGDAAVGELHPDHLRVLLTLAVYAVHQAEGAELIQEAVFIAAEAAALAFEVIELFVQGHEYATGLEVGRHVWVPSVGLVCHLHRNTTSLGLRQLSLQSRLGKSTLYPEATCLSTPAACPLAARRPPTGGLRRSRLLRLAF